MLRPEDASDGGMNVRRSVPNDEGDQARINGRFAAEALRDARVAADVFGLTYREHAEARGLDYRWRVVAPEAVSNLRRADRERWSAEKLADYLHSDADE